MREIWRELLRLRPYFSRKEKISYLTLLGMMILGALLDVIGIGAVPAFVAILAVPEQLMQYPMIVDIFDRFGLQPGNRLVLLGSVFLLFVFILKNAYLFWVYQYQFRLVEYQRVDLAKRLFSAYMYAPYTFILNRNSAELMRNVQVETLEIIRGIIIPGLGAVMGGIMAIFTVILLMLVTPWVALVGVIIIGGGSTLFFRAVKKRLENYGITAKEERKETLKAINQGISGFVDARILSRESFFIEAFTRSLKNFALVERLRQVISKSSPYILETISVAGLLLIILALIIRGQDAVSSIPTLALFGVAMIRLRQTVSQIVNGVTQSQYSLPAIGNVLDDLQELEHSQKKDLKKNKPAIPFQDCIRLEGVTFTYPNAEVPTLKDIDLTIKRGESVAFVGATGSGKSTLVNVILSLLEPTQGKVTVDGVDIRGNPAEWLTHVGYIPQSIFLTDDTIAQNIALGMTDAEIDTAQLWSAIRAAQLEDFILSLPQQEQTIVGERGVRLSGGQRQRIGLARALYHNPDILIMDEATSALDNQTESLVMEALENLRTERTFIMIAHRLSTVENCDRLFFLKNGEIKAVGKYQELVVTDSDFQRMVELV